MSGVQRNYRGRRYASGVGYRRRRYGYSRAARRGVRPSTVKKIVKKEIAKDIEYKRIDTSLLGNVALDFSNTQVYDITQIGQGVTDITRVGDKLKIVGLNMKLRMSAGDATNSMRIVIVQWRDWTTAIPAWSDLLEYTPSAQGFFGPFKKGSAGKFKVLWDKTFHLIIGADSQVQSIDVNINKGFEVTKYFPTSTTNSKGKLLFFFISDSSVPTHPYFEGYLRARFIDA